MIWFHSIDLDDPVLEFETDGLYPGVYIALLSSIETTEHGELEVVEIASKVTDPTTGNRRSTGYQRQRYEPRDPTGKIDWGKPSMDLGEAVGIGLYETFTSTKLLWAARFPGRATIRVRTGVIPAVQCCDLINFVRKAEEGGQLDVQLSRERR